MSADCRVEIRIQFVQKVWFLGVQVVIKLSSTRVLGQAINSRPMGLVNLINHIPHKIFTFTASTFHVGGFTKTLVAVDFSFTSSSQQAGLHRLRLQFGGNFRVKLRSQVKVDGASLLPVYSAQAIEYVRFRFIVHHLYLVLIYSQFIDKSYQHVRLIHLVQFVFALITSYQYLLRSCQVNLLNLDCFNLLPQVIQLRSNLIGEEC